MGRSSSCSSSTIESSSINPRRNRNINRNRNSNFLVTDLRLGLGDSDYTTTPMEDTSNWGRRVSDCEEENDSNMAALFVKVYMEGIPIGRKLNLVAHDGYHALIRTLDHMFSATILWADVEIVNSSRYHVLTYEDKEGDWLIVGDVPWEMFLTSVKRLKITRADRF